MATFQKVKLGDVADVQNGYAFKSDSFSTVGIPVIKIKNMASGKIIFNDNAYYDGLFNNLEKYFLYKDDILISMTGSHLTQINSAVGKVTKYNLGIRSLLNQRVGKIYTKDSNLCDKRFLYYLVCGADAQIFWAKKAGGTANQANISPDIIKELPISIPNIEKQQEIASVLSTYDCLIENNEKRIKALEEMAQLLYTEWFVRFKFPGNEKIIMVESNTECGKIPRGWEVKKLKDIGKAITGKTPPTGNLDNFDGEILFIKTPDIHGNIFVIETEQTLSDAGSNLQSSKLLPQKTVFISCIGTLGVVGIASKPSQTNQQINAIILNDKNDYIFFYFFAKNLKQQLVGLGSNGATMGNVNKDKFENINIIYPGEEIRKSFFKATTNLFDEILSLQKQNQNLAKTRDLLIPQLVTGKREVK